jgi:ligand-binding sensor domain-containing protein
VALPNYEDRVYVVAELPDGSLWVGGENYVATSTDFGLTWTQVGSSDGLGESILGIVQGEDGRVWAASNGGGVSVLQDGEWQVQVVSD